MLFDEMHLRNRRASVRKSTATGVQLEIF